MDEDLKALAGTWKVDSLQAGGAMLPPNVIAEARVVIDGTRFITSMMGASYEGWLALDADSNPKQITLHFDVGPEAGKTHLGIYRFEGEGLVFCLTSTGTRPAEFTSLAGSPNALERLSRVAE
jgi:uncharacterized protein (TIGR03067 family)